MSLRREFVMLALQEKAHRAELCWRFGVSRKTGYKWLTRFQEEGLRGLVDRPRRPEHSPHRTDPALEAAVVALRERHPAWGGRKLQRRLRDLGHRERVGVRGQQLKPGNPCRRHTNSKPCAHK